MSEPQPDNDALHDLEEECERQEKLSTPPWSLMVVGSRDDAERARQILPDLLVVGLDDPRLREELPTGPDSCVLAMGEVAMRAAAALRGAGVSEVYGRHLPPGCAFLSQFLTQKSVEFQAFGREAVRTAFEAWVGGAKRIDVKPEEHADLRRKPRLQGRSFEDLLDLPVPTTLIRAVLAEKAVVVLGGASRSWKSFLVLDWHLHLLYGIPWRDQRVRAGSSIYFCGEGQANAGKRIKAWKAYHEEQIQGIDRGTREFFVVGEVPTLTTKEGIADLRECLVDFVATHGPIALITIDTLSVGLTGEGDDENSNSMMSSIAAAMGAIRNEFNCTIILVHHLRKEPEKGKVTMNALRGGIALSCNVDQVFLVTRDGDEQKLRLDKNKDGEDDREIATSEFVVLPVGTDDEGFPTTSGVLVPIESEEALAEAAQVDALVQHYEAVFGHREFTQTDAEGNKPKGIARKELRSLLLKAASKGKLSLRPRGKGLYYAVPSSKEAP